MVKVNGKTIHAAADYKKGLIERLRASEELQREYLRANIEENSDMPEAILLAIRDIAEARGYEKLANDAGLSPKALYRILDEDKDAKPRFETISQIVQALGLRITVEPIDKVKAS